MVGEVFRSKSFTPLGTKGPEKPPAPLERLQSLICWDLFISSAPTTKSVAPALLKGHHKLAAREGRFVFAEFSLRSSPSVPENLVPIRPHFVHGIVLGHHHNLINCVSYASKHQCDIK